MAIDRGKSQTASQLTGTVWRTLTQPGSLVSIQTAASEAAQLALTAQEGDVVIRSDEDKVYMHNSSYGGTISDWTVFAVTSDYVDDGITAEDLDVDTDSGTIDIDLGSEILTIEGTGGQITTSASSTTVTLALESVLVGVTILPLMSFESISGPTTLNFTSNNNFQLTLTGNVTLQNPEYFGYSGQSGYIAFIQDGTGSRTVTLDTVFETVSGSGLTLSSAADTTDLVPYFIPYAGGSAVSSRILLGAPQLAFS